MYVSEAVIKTFLTSVTVSCYVIVKVVSNPQNIYKEEKPTIL